MGFSSGRDPGTCHVFDNHPQGYLQRAVSRRLFTPSPFVAYLLWRLLKRKKRNMYNLPSIYGGVQDEAKAHLEEWHIHRPILGLRGNRNEKKRGTEGIAPKTRGGAVVTGHESRQGVSSNGRGNDYRLAIGNNKGRPTTKQQTTDITSNITRALWTVWKVTFVVR